MTVFRSPPLDVLHGTSTPRGGYAPPQITQSRSPLVSRRSMAEMFQISLRASSQHGWQLFGCRGRARGCGAGLEVGE